MPRGLATPTCSRSRARAEACRSRPSSFAAGRIGGIAPSSRLIPTMFRKPRFYRAFLVQFYEDMPPPKRILVDRQLADRELLEEALSERAERKVVDRNSPTRRPPQADRTGHAQCRGSARPPARRDHHAGQDPARAGRRVRPCRRAQAHRGLRQQPHHGHQRDRRDDRRRARGLPQEQLSQVQHQAARRPGRATISR